MLSALPTQLQAQPPITFTPIEQNSPSAISAPFAPVDIQGAYGTNLISFNGTAGNGSGQTIAIIDAYNDPNIVSDVATFSSNYGLPAFNTTGNPTFAVLNQSGSSSPLPANVSSSSGDWDLEECLDVEWAHSIAPQANIVLFEANSSSDSNLFQRRSDCGGLPGRLRRVDELGDHPNSPSKAYMIPSLPRQLATRG